MPEQSTIIEFEILTKSGYSKIQNWEHKQVKG